MKLTRTVTVAIVCAFVLALAPAALAQSPATSAYGGPCSTASLCTSSSIGSKSTTPKATAATALPFTGINLLEVAAMGLVLAGAGVAMRRSRRPGND